MIKVSALPLLAYKVGPNLFDLSSNLHQVSMRDQLHRAVALAEALVAGNQFKSGDQVLIVGAGVAGIVAGMVLARHNVQVQIIDTSEDAPFLLQRGVTARYVGPYMYEWPLSVHGRQTMPATTGALLPWANGTPTTLPFGRRVPTRPGKLVTDWEPILEGAINGSNGLLRLQVGVDRDTTNASIKRWLHTERRNAGRRPRHGSPRSVKVHVGAPWRTSKPPHAPLKPRFVLLAAGMGSENNTVKDAAGKPLLSGKAFWANDDLGKKNCGQIAPPRVVVIGGGDGGLQDALRAATIDRQPLRTWNRLRKADTNGVLAGALPDIQSTEAQHALMSIWSTEVHLREQELRTLDAAYQAIAQRIANDPHIRLAVLKSLRQDVQSVHLCIKDAWFSKAYALNRFLVHLIEQCVLSIGNLQGKARLLVIRNVTLETVNGPGSAPTLTFADTSSLPSGMPLALQAEIVAVRFGPDRSELPGQWLGLTTKDTMNRQELATVPLPLYLPPSC